MNILRQEIRTGLLVVFSIAVLTTVTLYLGSPGVFIPQKGFVLYVDNANGLKPGAAVALAGRRVGQVIKLYSPVPEAERPDPTKETKIEIKVARSAKIYKKVRCLLTSNGLLGEFFIDFTGGQEDSGLAEEGTSFLVVRPPGLEQAVPMVLEALEPAIKSAVDTMGSLQKTADNLSELTKPDGEVPRTVAEFREFGTNLKEMSGPTGALHLTLENIATLTGPDGKIQSAMSNIEKLTSETGSLAVALKNAEKFTGDLAQNKDLYAALANAKKASAGLNDTLTELRFKFSAVGSNLEQASDTVKHQPWRLIWPSTKKYDGDETKPAARKSEAATPRPRVSGKRSAG